MTLPAAIVAHAKGSEDIAAIFGDRFFPVTAPQGAKLPFLVFRRIRLAFEVTLDKKTMVRAHYRFYSDALPADHKKAYAGAWRVWEAFHGLTKVNLGGPDGLSIEHILAQDLNIEAQEEYIEITADTGVVSVPMDLEFYYDVTKELL